MRQAGRLVEWPANSGQLAVSALVLHGRDEGVECWFSLTRDGRWYVDDGWIGSSQPCIVRWFARACGLSLREARALLPKEV